MLKSVGLENKGDEYPVNLSGGEQQRVAIARALSVSPEAILCDEPTGALDKRTGTQIMELLHSVVKENGIMLLLVTHDPDIADTCDTIFEMDGGRITYAKNENLNWPEGITLPDTLEGEDTGASFQVGYGDTRASNLWEYTWMKEWLDTYNTDSERAEKALEELAKAFDMPYMGTDRCDDATRNYLRNNIDKAKLGDPSGFTECIRANYAD